MKLRQIPIDFKVQEINDLEIIPRKGNYKIFSVEKEGIETFYLLGYLAKTNNIPKEDITVSGLKDKHASTVQYLCIPARYDMKTLQEKNFRLKFLGYSDSKLKLGDLKGNYFEITVRDIKKGELEGIYQKSKNIVAMGVPNYFDSQRFGSALDKEFIAKEIMKGNYEKACRIYLTRYPKTERKSIKDDKRRILAAWPNLSNVKVENRALSCVVQEYNKTKDWNAAYRKIPQELREIYISAYQSYLWNECIKTLLRRNIDSKAIYSVEYSVGSLLFYKRITQNELQKLPKTFQTISDQLVARENEKSIIERVFEREGIKGIDDFKIKEKTGNFFKSREREVILFPKRFSITNPQLDELNDRGKENSFKIIVRFELPKASYATVIIKRLFNQ